MSTKPGLKINEIFYSLQGETSWSGYPTVFVRTTGCHLRCTYCDTKYSYYEGQELSLDSIIEQIKTYGAKYVCVTGGEPLLQKNILPLMRILCDLGYQVSLETSGAKSCADVDPRVKIILDIKTPDSGAPDTFLSDNLIYGSALAEYKFVICSERDFEWSESFVKDHLQDRISQVLYSPSFGHTKPDWLAEKILSSKSKVRMQLQMHKFIWSPEARGV